LKHWLLGFTVIQIRLSKYLSKICILYNIVFKSINSQDFQIFAKVFALKITTTNCKKEKLIDYSRRAILRVPACVPVRLETRFEMRLLFLFAFLELFIDTSVLS